MSKVYITFGQIHAHSCNGRTFDKDSVAVISCEDYEDGRKKAFEFFGDKWHNCTIKKPDMSYYPRGILEAN